MREKPCYIFDHNRLLKFSKFDDAREYCKNSFNATGETVTIFHDGTDGNLVCITKENGDLIGCSVKSKHFSIFSNEIYFVFTNKVRRVPVFSLTAADGTMYWDKRKLIVLLINLEMNLESLLKKPEEGSMTPMEAINWYISRGIKTHRLSSNRQWKNFVFRYKLISNPLSRIGSSIRRKYKNEIHYRKTL